LATYSSANSSDHHEPFTTSRRDAEFHPSTLEEDEAFDGVGEPFLVAVVRPPDVLGKDDGDLRARYQHVPADIFRSLPFPDADANMFQFVADDNGYTSRETSKSPER
jgi:hypothetical protein